MRKLICAGGMALLATGCASIGNLNTAFRTTDIEANEAVFVDAHQRAIVSNERVVPGSFVSTTRGNSTTIEPATQHIVCAEPGPDVFAARSGSLSGNASTPEVSAGLAGATGESAGQLSAPTTAILSQRHAYYRICEAYMNGVGDDIEYMVGVRSNQRDLPTLLAIEQLTGAVRAAPTVLSSGGTATSGQVLAQLTTYRAAAEARREEYQRQVTSLTSQHAAAVARIAAIDERLAQTGVADDERIRLNQEKTAKAAERDRLLAEKSAAQASMTRAEEDIRRLEEAIRNAREGSASVNSSGVVLAQAGGISPESAQHISNAIVRILEMSNSRDFGPTTCMAILRRPSAEAGIVAHCNDILTAYAATITASAAARQNLGTQVQPLLQAARTRALTDAEVELVRFIIETTQGENPISAATLR